MGCTAATDRVQRRWQTYALTYVLIMTQGITKYHPSAIIKSNLATKDSGPFRNSLTCFRKSSAVPAENLLMRIRNEPKSFGYDSQERTFSAYVPRKPCSLNFIENA